MMATNIMTAVFGGLLIGLSATLMLWLLGRITGISGIVWQAFSTAPGASFSTDSWRWFFIAGLLLGPILVHYLLGIPIPLPSDSGPLVVVAAGFLVGFGTHLGSGCTSGHGICGIGRLSKRSLIATAAFMAFGILTTFLIRHVIQA